MVVSALCMGGEKLEKESKRVFEFRAGCSEPLSRRNGWSRDGMCGGVLRPMGMYGLAGVSVLGGGWKIKLGARPGEGGWTFGD